MLYPLWNPPQWHRLAATYPDRRQEQPRVGQSRTVRQYVPPDDKYVLADTIIGTVFSGDIYFVALSQNLKPVTRTN